MKILALLLASALTLPVAPSHEDGDGKKKKKGKDQYHKYEQEDVTVYRDRTTFHLPEPSLITTEQVSEVKQAVPLAPLFSGNQQLIIDQSPLLSQLVNKHVAIGKATKKLDGYRIQVYAGSNRQQAIKMKQELLAKYPNFASYDDYISPNYVVRIGDFLDKEEALLFRRELRLAFPGAFIVPTRVNIPKLKNLEEEDQMVDENGFPVLPDRPSSENEEEDPREE
ncbi:SPOR domain-containing protein [Pontibacter sp. G13]|uniref:SPOR domain-containing protein n=1 Tax=Pontibacter sp. G13 TaxID=3074898 RepID=UPI00288A8C01|nr:SPOR domain-containing protein [Pontibacter sp. G13]WNJ21149.1 SPOR domain-containing protein [Pontibacter sp. G13]